MSDEIRDNIFIFIMMFITFFVGFGVGHCVTTTTKEQFIKCAEVCHGTLGGLIYIQSGDECRCRDGFAEPYSSEE